jgi:OOP family OmpA-OmpF porin
MRQFHFPGLKVVGSIAAAILVAGCAGQQLGKAKMVQPGGGEFSSTLYNEYIMLSQMEFDEGDYGDSDLFATRAMAAAGGENVPLEAVDFRMLPGVAKGEIAQAHRELSELLEATAREKASVNAAKAQAAYECWTQEQEENFQPKDIAACRDKFNSLLAAIKLAMAPAPAAAPAPAPAPRFANFAVYFGFDKSDVDDEGMKTLYQAVLAVDEMNPSTVTIKGFTDRAGSAEYNDKLAERRAREVARLLDDNTSTDLSGKIVIEVYGERDGIVETADGVREPRNRRALIEVVR